MVRVIIVISVLASIGLCPCSAQTNDFPDVTLQPWSALTAALTYGPGSRCVTGTNGVVIVYGPPNVGFGDDRASVSLNFGQDWRTLTQLLGWTGYASATLSDCVPGISTAASGNGWFLSSWSQYISATWVTGKSLINRSGNTLTGYGKMAFGNDMLIGVEAYSTYVSSDQGTNWTPYLNPWTPDEGALVSFNRVLHDGASFVAVSAPNTSSAAYAAFQGSTWRSSDGVNWRRILATNAVVMDSQSRVVLAQSGKIYDLVGDSLVAAHLEFPKAEGRLDYHRVGGRIYSADGSLLYYSDDKGVTRYRTGFPAAIAAVWSMPALNGQHAVRVLLADKRMFTSKPVTTPIPTGSLVTLASIELRPMLTFEATAGVTVIIEASTNSDGPWSEVTRVTSMGGKQMWNDNRSMARALFYRARAALLSTSIEP